MDLTKLYTVKALAKQLLLRGQHLDAVVCNAGIAGWSGLNFARATWEILTDLVHATTYPTYTIPIVGLIANPQDRGSSASADTKSDDEPKLGQVFLSNLFGHYLLTHWLSPLLKADSRVVWISSVAALAENFDIDDLQGLRAPMSYESSKRLTELLVLTSGLQSTQPYVAQFFDTQRTADKPKMYLTHPGVIATSIIDLGWFLDFFVVAALYLARWVGSYWHPVTPYKGAVSAAFAVLALPSQLSDLEAREGKGKWGSACSVQGDERVARTEVEGWGFCGRVGVMPSGSISSAMARHRRYKQTSKEMREQFEEDGRRCWKEMEEMRLEWEKRLGPVTASFSEDP